MNEAKNALTMTKLENTIPANTAVLLYAEEGFGPYYVCGDTEAEAMTVTTGALTGILSAGTVVEAGSYVLQILPEGACFCKTKEVTDGTKNKCFVSSDFFTSDATTLSVIFENEPTGIKETTISKINRNDSLIYNVSGQRVSDKYRGLKISGGKKVVH